MIKRWVPLESVIDNYLDETDSFETGDSKIHMITRKAKRYAYELYSKCNAPLYIENHEGIVKNNMVELPEGFCRFEALQVDGNPVSVTMQNFLRKATETKSVNSVYTGKLIGEYIQFNVFGGDVQGLNGKPYILEYKTVPMINGILYVPEQFEAAIHAKLDFSSMKKRIMLNGRGEGLIRTYNQMTNDTVEEALVDVEFPSWEEMIAIGKIWESKIPLRVERGRLNNFTTN